MPLNLYASLDSETLVIFLIEVFLSFSINKIKEKKTFCKILYNFEISIKPKCIRFLKPPVIRVLISD